MKEADKSRRGFLKSLGIASVAAVLPFPIFKGFKTKDIEGDVTKKQKLPGPSEVDNQAMMLSWREAGTKHPENPQEGWAYYNEEHDVILVYDGSQWCVLAEGPR